MRLRKNLIDAQKTSIKQKLKNVCFIFFYSVLNLKKLIYEAPVFHHNNPSISHFLSFWIYQISKSGFHINLDHRGTFQSSLTGIITKLNCHEVDAGVVIYLCQVSLNSEGHSLLKGILRTRK